MTPGMPMPRLPDVIGGNGDALERFMADYLVGMFDDAAPLAIGAAEEVELQHVFKWRGMAVDLVQLPAGGELHSTADADLIEFDLFVEIERAVGGVLVPAGQIIGIQAVRIPAGVPCTRRAGPRGAAWLAFRGTPQ
jgi:hypothetical protein